MQQINPLKRINLEQYQKPKTLIVVHYKGKRISVPLLGECKNITQMLYHHIDKFEQSVLKADPDWEVRSMRKIVCFCSSGDKEHNAKEKGDKESNSIKKNIEKFLKYSDGDLKIDLLLSMIRIQQTKTNPQIDITKYYKYMEIQPYFIEYPLQNSQTEHSLRHKYYFYRLLEKNRIKNTYLARSLENGYFYSIKIYRSGLGMGQHEARLLSSVSQRLQGSHGFSVNSQQLSTSELLKNQDQVIPYSQIYMIPSQQQQEDEDEPSGNYKHLAIVSKYNIKGKLSDRINDKNYRITESDLLKYLKQLVWIVHELHEEYNVVHRNLTPESFELDEEANLKLISFGSWVECYDREGRLLGYPSKGRTSGRSDMSIESSKGSYEEEFEPISDGWYNIGRYTPPQVISRQIYNKFVDYYTIGMVIKQIHLKISQFQSLSSTSESSRQSSHLIETMISALTSSKLQEREQIVIQLIQSIKKSKLQETERKNRQVQLNLSEIRLGQQIVMESNLNCVENQENEIDWNGINHQEIVNFFKPNKEIKQSIYEDNGSQYQAKKEESKEKKKISHLVKMSKDSNVSNSRDKSVKSMKSNKSKDKSRTKSKVSSTNPKGSLEKSSQQLQKKPKSKSQKKPTSPERNSFNAHPMNSATNSKLSKPHLSELNGNNPCIPQQKKSKSKSCDKLKVEKSPDRKSKQKKLLTYTLAGVKHHTDEGHKTIMSRTAVHVPLPPGRGYKSPGKNA